jgi:hypothetical protein
MEQRRRARFAMGGDHLNRREDRLYRRDAPERDQGTLAGIAPAKRDAWGQKRQRNRAPEEWVRFEAPELRIVSDQVWQAAPARLARLREATCA